MKVPLACLLAIVAVVFLAVASIKFTISQLHSELPSLSLCELPVISRVFPCVASTGSPNAPSLVQHADFPALDEDPEADVPEGEHACRRAADEPGALAVQA